MRRLRPIILFGAIALAAVSLSACGEAPPLTGQAQADAQTRTACEQSAEEVYTQQNREDIYRPPDNVNTPYSSGYVPGASDRGLSQIYAHDRLVNDCIRNKGTEPLSASQPNSR